MQLFINALIAGSFAALIAAGLSLVYGVLKVFNMALGQLALVAGFSTWWMYRVLEMPLVFSILGGLLIGGLITWIAFELCVAPFYQRHIFLPLVSTIALSMILEGCIQMLFGEQPRSVLSAAKQQLHVGTATIAIEQLVLIAFTAGVLIALAWMLHSTSLGRKIRATVAHPHAAQSLGISSSLLHRLVFLFSGIVAGLGGIYIGIDQNLTPLLGFPITIKAYAALIAGGKGNLWGTVACAYLIAFIEQIAIGVPWFGFYIPAGYQASVALLTIIVVLLMKPEGIFGARMRAT